jgi:hypothetical protein
MYSSFAPPAVEVPVVVQVPLVRAFVVWKLVAGPEAGVDPLIAGVVVRVDLG